LGGVVGWGRLIFFFEQRCLCFFCKMVDDDDEDDDEDDEDEDDYDDDAFVCNVKK